MKSYISRLRRGGARGETEEGFAALVLSELEKVPATLRESFSCTLPNLSDTLAWKRCTPTRPLSKGPLRNRVIFESMLFMESCWKSHVLTSHHVQAKHDILSHDLGHQTDLGQRVREGNSGQGSPAHHPAGGKFPRRRHPGAHEQPGVQGDHRLRRLHGPQQQRYPEGAINRNRYAAKPITVALLKARRHSTAALLFVGSFSTRQKSR